MGRARYSMNFFAGAGYLVEDARFFTTRTGNPKVTFRMVLPRHPRLPKKHPEDGDYYTVIALGDEFVGLLDHLSRGTPVVVFGYAQSRDVTVQNRPRVVNEIGADAIYLVRDLSEQAGDVQDEVQGAGQEAD